MPIVPKRPVPKRASTEPNLAAKGSLCEIRLLWENPPSQVFGEKTLGKQHPEAGLLKADTSVCSSMPTSAILPWHLFYKWSCLTGWWEFRKVELRPS